MARLYVCGEALIDFVPCEVSDGTMAFIPKTGGSPYNIARAAARAGADVSFIGAFSSDMFGDQLVAELSSHGVDCSLAPVSDHPTTLAFVDVSQGSPRYAFFTENTATRNMAPYADMIEAGPGDILNVGSISLIENPAADNIVDFCIAMSAKMRVAMDPNVRPSMTADKADWLARIERLSSVVSVIKLSDEDLDYMYPGLSPNDYADRMLDGKTELVIVTLGGDGAQAFTQKAAAAVKPPVVEIADTVGAGDALMGGVLSWLLEHCGDPPNAIAALSENQLEDMLRFSTTGAALNCTRVGASPSDRQEILEAIAALSD